MRAILAALLLTLAAPAAADDWVHYNNDAYGFELDIPPGYVGRAETSMPDGQLFQGDTSDITVSAGPLTARDFEAQVKAQIADDAEAGWGFVFQLSTPRAASYGVQMGDRRMWTGLIPVCGGKGFAEVNVTYGSADAVAMQRPVSRMERSLKSTGVCTAL